MDGSSATGNQSCVCNWWAGGGGLARFAREYMYGIYGKYWAASPPPPPHPAGHIQPIYTGVPVRLDL